MRKRPLMASRQPKTAEMRNNPRHGGRQLKSRVGSNRPVSRIYPRESQR
jgi:hypothetical protein